MIDRNVDEDDEEFNSYECKQEFSKDTYKKVSEQFDFLKRVIYKSKFKNKESARMLKRNKREN